jgi:hypothetical protein
VRCVKKLDVIYRARRRSRPGGLAKQSQWMNGGTPNHPLANNPNFGPEDGSAMFLRNTVNQNATQPRYPEDQCVENF